MITLIAGERMRQACGRWSGGPVFAGESSIGDMDRELAMAAGHVAEARQIVARQRARILKLKALGKATPDHELTLQAFVSTLAQMEGHIRELAHTAKRFGRPPRLLS